MKNKILKIQDIVLMFKLDPFELWIKKFVLIFIHLFFCRAALCL